MSSTASIRAALALVSVAASALLAACGTPPGAVGGHCATNRDCMVLCVTGNSHWPDGLCTRHCSDDRDCPGGTACIDDEGGICAVQCAQSSQCSGYGPAYTCAARDRHGAPGSIMVCRAP